MPPSNREGRGERAEEVGLCTSWRGAGRGGADRPRSRSLGARSSPSLETEACLCLDWRRREGGRAGALRTGNILPVYLSAAAWGGAGRR